MQRKKLNYMQDISRQELNTKLAAGYMVCLLNSYNKLPGGKKVVAFGGLWNNKYVAGIQN